MAGCVFMVSYSSSVNLPGHQIKGIGKVFKFIPAFYKHQRAFLSLQIQQGLILNEQRPKAVDLSTDSSWKENPCPAVKTKNPETGGVDTDGPGQTHTDHARGK